MMLDGGSKRVDASSKQHNTNDIDCTEILGLGRWYVARAPPFLTAMSPMRVVSLVFLPSPTGRTSMRSPGAHNAELHRVLGVGTASTLVPSSRMLPPRILRCSRGGQNVSPTAKWIQNEGTPGVREGSTGELWKGESTRTIFWFIIGHWTLNTGQLTWTLAWTLDFGHGTRCESTAHCPSATQMKTPPTRKGHSPS